MREGARRIGLPTAGERLADLVAGDELARFAAGLVRVSLDDGLASEIRDAARRPS